MTRTEPATTLDRRINDIVARAAQEIAQTVRESIVEEVNRVVSGHVPVSVPAAAPTPTRKRRVILCPVPGCGKPGGGPKWGWFCADHKNLPDAEKEKARAARGSTPPPAPAPEAKKPARKKNAS